MGPGPIASHLMTQTLTIGGVEVPPGTTRRLELPVARLFTQQMLRLPVVAVHGAQPGPRMWITAAIHGDEIGGTEVVRRVLTQLDPAMLRGIVVAVPVVNVWGFLDRSRYLPDRRDLNRSFPGTTKGSLAAHIAYLLLTEIVVGSSCGIDLHAGSHHRSNLPQIRGDLDDARVRVMADAFAAPATVHGKLRSGSIRHAAARRGIPCLLYEAGGTLRFDEPALRVGTAGILRVLAHLGMRDDAPAASHPPFVSRETHWVRCARAGILHLRVDLGHRVERGAIVGVVRDTFGDITARVRSKDDGLVIGITENPLVNRGDAVLHIAVEERPV